MKTPSFLKAFGLRRSSSCGEVNLLPTMSSVPTVFFSTGFPTTTPKLETSRGEIPPITEKSDLQTSRQSPRKYMGLLCARVLAPSLSSLRMRCACAWRPSGIAMAKSRTVLSVVAEETRCRRPRRRCAQMIGGRPNVDSVDGPLTPPRCCVLKVTQQCAADYL